MRHISGRNSDCHTLQKNENVTIKTCDMFPYINAFTAINYEVIRKVKLHQV